MAYVRVIAEWGYIAGGCLALEWLMLRIGVWLGLVEDDPVPPGE